MENTVVAKRIDRIMMMGPFAAVLIAILQLSSGCSASPSQDPLGHAQADRIIVEKAKRQLHLLASGKVLRTYRIALGRNPVGPKTQEGDGKTPEGVYVIDGRKRQCVYHRALHISYPSVAEVDRARRAGMPAHRAL